jgi:hypothetical protein
MELFLNSLAIAFPEKAYGRRAKCKILAVAILKL